MKYLKEYITESLLDDFDTLADNMDTNIFNYICDAQSQSEFDKRTDELFEMCDKIDIYDQQEMIKHKKSFFIVRACYYKGTPVGVVIDKMQKKSTYSGFLTRPYMVNTPSKYPYKYDTTNKLNIEDNSFASYSLYDEVKILPKNIEKQYLEFVEKMPRDKIIGITGRGTLLPSRSVYNKVLYGDKLLKKIK